MKRSLFGSWWYIGFALLAYYGICRVAFSFQTIDPAIVVLSGRSCDVVALKPSPDGYCTATGRLSYSLTGEQWLTPASRSGVRVRVPTESAIAHGAGAEHFPGGDFSMGYILILPWVLLFAPIAYALSNQISDIGRRWAALVEGRE